MKRRRGAKVALGVAGAVVGAAVLLAGAGWLGLRIEPGPFPAHSETTPELAAVGLPSGLPEPVRRHYQVAMGDRIPQVETAVMWGRADFKVNGLWTPMRFKSYTVAGRDFRRDMEITWFGHPVLYGSDTYLAGEGRLDISGLVNVSEAGERIDQGQNLALWGEALYTTPSALVLDPRVRWEPVDAHTARLIVPFGDDEEALTAEFDPQSGLLRSVTGMRYRGQKATKTPWRGEFSEWRPLHGMEVPHRVEGIWEDEREPYAIFEIEGAEYNVDVSGKVPGNGQRAQGGAP